jgi:hypothetical protein
MRIRTTAEVTTGQDAKPPGWLAAYAITKLTAAEHKRIVALLSQALSWPAARYLASGHRVGKLP